MTASKTPTASGISRLLREAGFERSTSEGGSLRSTGFEVEAGLRAGEVLVYWHSPLTRGAASRRPRELAAYAATIASAGSATKIAEYCLVVTAKTED